MMMMMMMPLFNDQV